MYQFQITVLTNGPIDGTPCPVPNMASYHDSDYIFHNINHQVKAKTPYVKVEAYDEFGKRVSVGDLKGVFSDGTLALFNISVVR